MAMAAMAPTMARPLGRRSGGPRAKPPPPRGLGDNLMAAPAGGPAAAPRGAERAAPARAGISSPAALSSQ